MATKCWSLCEKAGLRQCFCKKCNVCKAQWSKFQQALAVPSVCESFRGPWKRFRFFRLLTFNFWPHGTRDLVVLRPGIEVLFHTFIMQRLNHSTAGGVLFSSLLQWKGKDVNGIQPGWYSYLQQHSYKTQCGMHFLSFIIMIFKFFILYRHI